MDFELNPETEMIRDLSTQILDDRVSPEALSDLDRQGTWWDLETYGHLARSGVVGCVVPEELGGAGLTFHDLHHVLVEAGRRVAQVPLFETVVLGALPIVRHGSVAQRQEWLPGVAAGDVLLTGALVEPGGAPADRPRTTATRVPGGWRLAGTKDQVGLLPQAQRVLVAATVEETGAGALFLVDPAAPGVRTQEQRTVARRPVVRLELDAVEVPDAALVGDTDGAALADVLLHAAAALSSIAAGVSAGALALAAAYTTGREQFGQALSSFQAVRQRLADGYIDVEAMRLTSLQAAWRLASDLDADEAVRIAKFWAADGGHRVLHTAQHVHGGMGIDLDYELHRHYRMGKWAEFTLGSANQQLRAVGRGLATAH
jgi:alkylation response protein AidB-like acyl-CoA dehydrogenase